MTKQAAGQHAGLHLAARCRPAWLDVLSQVGLQDARDYSWTSKQEQGISGKVVVCFRLCLMPLNACIGAQPLRTFKR